MKLAYLSYDGNAAKTHSILEQSFSMIDSYQISNEDFLAGESVTNLLSLPIMAKNVFIPGNEALQTFQHKVILHQIKNEYNFFKQNIFSKYKLAKEEYTDDLGEANIDDEIEEASDEAEMSIDEERLKKTLKTQSSSIRIKKSVKRKLSLESVSSLLYNKTINKYVLQSSTEFDPQFIKNQVKGENGAKHTTQYDYVLIEGHRLISDVILSKEQNIISKSQQQTHVVLNLEFPLQYRLDSQHLHHEFLFIDNIQLKTIFDNWFICSLSHNKICVRLMIPFEKQNSEDFLNFLSLRTYKMLCRNFEAFEFMDLRKRWISTCDGFAIKNYQLNYTKSSSIMPSFTFWPQYKINNYTREFLGTIKKKNKSLFIEREI